MWQRHSMVSGDVVQHNAGRHNPRCNRRHVVERPLSVDAAPPRLDGTVESLDDVASRAMGLVVAGFRRARNCMESRRHQPRFQWVTAVACEIEHYSSIPSRYIMNTMDEQRSIFEGLRATTVISISLAYFDANHSLFPALGPLAEMWFHSKTIHFVVVPT